MRRAAAAALLAVTAQPAAAALDAADLMGEAGEPALRPMADFAPGDGGDPAKFQGTLRLSGGIQRVRVLRDDDKLADEAGGARSRLPDLTIDLVRIGDALVPTRRGPIRADHPSWEWIVEPGRVWTQPGDRGLSRAAIPFALAERNQNCVHHGVVSFLYGADGTVSKAAYEIAGETCAYYRFDGWGRLDAEFRPHPVERAADLARAWADEQGHRLPVKPLAALAKDHPGANPAPFGTGPGLAPADISAYGVMLDGVHYAGACTTRQGPYPFCDERVLPSYSLAKTLVGGLGLMRLELLHPGASVERVAGLVSACAKSGGWDDVRLVDLLDMASGHYALDGFEADEDSAAMGPFFDAERHDARVAFACTAFPRRAPPGTVGHYHTNDTYLLGTAMAALVRRDRGPAGDFYEELLAGPVWHGLGLSPLLDATRRTRDAAAQPFTGYGLYLHTDDILRLAGFLAAGTGRIGDRAVVDPSLLQAGLQRDPADPGREAGSPHFRYRAGLWARDVAPVVGCDRPVWVPFLSGYGGISVVMMPNGLVYYVFSDGGALDWAEAAKAAHQIRSLCPGKP
jgi:hypothetical protein